MHTITARVSAFFATPTSSDFLSFYRIATALLGLATVAVLSPSVLDIYGPEGFIQWVISDQILRVERLPSLVHISDLLDRSGLSGGTVVKGAFALYAGALAGLLLGWRTRLSAAAAWLLHFLILNTNMIFGYGVETFIHLGLFYSLVFPSAESWSLDARAGRTGARRWSVDARIAQRVLQLHACIVYLNAGVAKGFGSDWWSGEAIWRSTMQPSYGQFDMSWMAAAPMVSLLAGWGTLLVEGGYLFFIWPRRTRPFWLAAVLLLHAGIGVLMGLWLFAGSMIVLNIAAFGWDYVTSLAGAATGAVRRATRGVASSDGSGQSVPANP
jgi:hypothetical protein